MRHFKMQLIDAITQKSIQSAGGVVYVAANGDLAKATLYDADGAAASNPSALTNGVIEFYTADTVDNVDLYIQAPSGHFVVVKGIFASGPNAIYIDKTKLETTMVIPCAIENTAAATETNTGFSIPTKGIVTPVGVGFETVTIDSGITIDIGTLSTASGDADGFIDGVSVATAGFVKGTLTNGSVTLGALLKVQDSANAGDAVPESNTTMAGKAITYTLSSGADTAEGFILLPIRLPASAL